MSVEYFAVYQATYVSVSLGITVWVGRTLSRNGLVFLIENFEGREALARSVNHLLLVGFYLINVGFMSLMLGYGGRPTDTVEGIEHLGTKVGLVVVLLGVMHFTNMYVLMLFRRAALFRLIEAKAPAVKAGPWSTPQPTGHP